MACTNKDVTIVVLGVLLLLSLCQIVLQNQDYVDGSYSTKEKVPIAIKDIQTSSSSSTCSCLSTNNNNATCCSRFVLTTHKCGHALSRELFPDFATKSQINPNRITEASGDYRHAVIMRNLYDAVVSGYLYHRAGRECWLAPNNNRIISPEKKIGWKKRLQYPIPQSVDNQKTSICGYLANATEYDGMKVYMDWIYKKYRRTRDYYQASTMQAGLDGFNKTMIVCFEDLIQPEKKIPLVQDMVDFLYPSGHSLSAGDWVPVDTYEGAHATSHEPVQRTRLRDLAVQFDKEVFDGSLQKANDLYRCGI